MISCYEVLNTCFFHTAINILKETISAVARVGTTINLTTLTSMTGNRCSALALVLTRVLNLHGHEFPFELVVRGVSGGWRYLQSSLPLVPTVMLRTYSRRRTTSASMYWRTSARTRRSGSRPASAYMPMKSSGRHLLGMPCDTYVPLTRLINYST